MIRSESVTQLIEELNQTDETASLEAKRATDVGKSILETINSLSNEPGLNGGTILLGIEKDENDLFPVYKITGVDDPDKIVTDIATQSATMFNIPIRPTINTEFISGKAIVRVDVSELPASQKPLYFSSRGLPLGAFRRIGSSDIRFNSDDLYALLSGRAPEPADCSVVNGASWDDIEPDAVAAYRRYRSEVNRFAEELNYDDQDLLISLRAAVRKLGEIFITVSGLINFGKSSSLRRIFPTHRIEYLRVPGRKWVSDPENRYQSIEIRGAALLTIGRVVSAILDDIPKAFKLKENNLQRDDIPLIPEKVIREAVVNAVAHRNYQKFSPIQIVRYSNRLEIRNPGCSLKSEDQFDEPGSMLRNPYLAEVLHETRFAETKGTGIRVMRQRMAEMQLTQPAFVSSRENDQFSATFLFHHFLNEEDWRWLSRFQSFGLDNDQMRALIFLREMGAIDNAAYRNLCGVDVIAASVGLRKLKEHNLITAKGSGSSTYYVPSPLFDSPTRDEMLDAGMPRVSHETSHETSHEKTGGMGEKQILDRVGFLTSESLPLSLRLEIASLRGRANRTQSEAVIRKICRLQPSSAETIGALLNRNADYVRKRFLNPMVNDGVLKYTIPDMIKHPDQKYAVGPNSP